jgi:DNA polymerase I
MLIVADGNNLAWAGFHALGRAMGADTPERKTRATLLGLAQAVFGLVMRAGEPPTGRRNQPVLGGRQVTGVVVAFDEGRPLRRRSIYPAYQTGREGQSSFMDNEPYVLAAVAEFVDAATFMPVTILRGTNTEADDLIAAYVLQADPVPARIASTDRDFLQLVDERVSVYSPVKKVVIDDASFDELVLPKAKDGTIYRFPRERFVDFRALCGDSSDDLPGVDGIGEVTAARLLAHAPLDDYLANPALVSTALDRGAARVQEKLTKPETREIVERNRALMDLRVGASHYADLGPVSRIGRWDRERFRAWLEEQRIARADTDTVVGTFEQLAAQQA